MPESKTVTVVIHSGRPRGAREAPRAPLGEAIDILAEHITYQYECGSKVKSQQLAVVRDQLSTLRAQWGCR